MNQVETQMQELRLTGMLQQWKSLLETRNHHQLTLEEGLQVLLQSEAENRENNRFERLVKQARFRYQASVAELNYQPSRGLHKDQISRLTTGDYIKKGESILITGATGCGKSFVASALGHQACRLGHKVMYFNMQKFLIKTKMARLDGSIIRLFNQIAKTDLLILDDFGLTHLEKQQQLDLMEIIEDRHTKSALIIASQLPVASWFQIIAEQTIADAIMDRLVHTSHRIELKGESLRKLM